MNRETQARLAVVITDQEKIDCLKREVALRQRSYPAWVREGRMTKVKAEREIRILQAVLNDYERKGDLFGGAL